LMPYGAKDTFAKIAKKLEKQKHPQHDDQNLRIEQKLDELFQMQQIMNGDSHGESPAQATAGGMNPDEAMNAGKPIAQLGIEQQGVNAVRLQDAASGYNASNNQRKIMMQANMMPIPELGITDQDTYGYFIDQHMKGGPSKALQGQYEGYMRDNPQSKYTNVGQYVSGQIYNPLVNARNRTEGYGTAKLAPGQYQGGGLMKGLQDMGGGSAGLGVLSGVMTGLSSGLKGYASGQAMGSADNTAGFLGAAGMGLEGVMGDVNDIVAARQAAANRNSPSPTVQQKEFFNVEGTAQGDMQLPMNQMEMGGYAGGGMYNYGGMDRYRGGGMYAHGGMYEDGGENPYGTLLMLLIDENDKLRHRSKSRGAGPSKAGKLSDLQSKVHPQSWGHYPIETSMRRESSLLGRSHRMNAMDHTPVISPSERGGPTPKKKGMRMGGVLNYHSPLNKKSLHLAVTRWA